MLSWRHQGFIDVSAARVFGGRASGARRGSGRAGARLVAPELRAARCGGPRRRAPGPRTASACVWSAAGRGDDEPLVRRERDQVGVVAGGDRALAGEPGQAAGLAAIHRATSARPKPRAPACVQITGRPSCTEEIPPHAAPKSPRSRVLQLGRARRVVGHDAVDRAVARSPAQSRSRLSTPLIGGQHLNSVAPSGTCSAASVR